VFVSEQYITKMFDNPLTPSYSRYFPFFNQIRNVLANLFWQKIFCNKHSHKSHRLLDSTNISSYFSKHSSCSVEEKNTTKKQFLNSDTRLINNEIARMMASW